MSFIKSIATFGGFTMISRLTGFLRDMVIATFLGAGMVSDAFLVSFKLPNLFRSLFAEGAFTSAFVPLFSSKLVASGRDKSIEFAAKAISLLTFFLIIFSILFELAMPWVVRVNALGRPRPRPRIRRKPRKSRINHRFMPHYFSFFIVYLHRFFPGGNPKFV